MTSLYSLAEIRAIEQAAQTSLPPGSLMQRAGHAAADLALRLPSFPESARRVLILAGPGNNGGDALEAAARLRQAGFEVVILMFADPAKYSAEAAQALQRARESGARFADPAQAASVIAEQWPLVIDGLFGIGLTRPITGELRELIAQLNRRDGLLLALDIPSGLDADTGNVVGNIVGNGSAAGIAVRATHTLTFIGDKPGLHTADGRDYAGKVAVADLGIDAALFPQPRACRNALALFSHGVQRRRHNSHKGSYGDVAILGGAEGMAGAPVLAARAAAHCGAGRVLVAFAGPVQSIPAYDSLSPELMFRSAQTLDFSRATVVAGPGLGTSREANDLLAKALHAHTPLVLDADALNLLAAEPGLQHKLLARTASANLATLLTPHPLEAARLLDISSAVIQTDRMAAARELAQRFKAVVVLKGSGSIIAGPDGFAVINPTGNPALATAGSGDVLSGICGALLAQGRPPWGAALAAVWLHGAAADTLVEHGIGPIGVTAGELIPVVRELLNDLADS